MGLLNVIRNLALRKKLPIREIARNYMFEEDGRWEAFTRFLDDGRICLTNNAAERALRVSLR